MVYKGLGRPDAASHLWGASQAMRDAMGAPVPPNERARYRREMDMLSAQLGEEGFQRAYAEGYSMTSEEAVGEAFDKAGEKTLL